MPTQRQKIVITNPVHADVIDLLEAKHDVDSNQSGVPWTERQLLQRARTADALMVFMPDRIDADMLSVCPRLKIVAGALKGYDNFDRVACTRQGVWLTIVPDLLTDPTAELTVGLMISLGRNLLVGDRYVRSGEFQGWRSHLYGKNTWDGSSRSGCRETAPGVWCKHRLLRSTFYTLLRGVFTTCFARQTRKTHKLQ